MLVERYKENPCAGVMLNEVAFPNFPLIMRQSGLDFMILDSEHGGFDYSAMASLIMGARQAGLPVIVRLADNSRKDITKVMDMGADGLLLPMTNTADQIRQVVRYAKYAPEGQRGISTNRGHTFYNPGNQEEYMKQANDSTMVFAQIETGEGLRNVDEILGVEGVYGVFVGPNDLACDLGCLGSETKEPVLSAIREVGQAAGRCGKRAGIITERENFLQEARKAGFDLMCSGSEISLWKKGGYQTVEKIHHM